MVLFIKQTIQRTLLTNIFQRFLRIKYYLPVVFYADYFQEVLYRDNNADRIPSKGAEYFF